MKMERCSAGIHVYDVDANASCPFCRPVDQKVDSTHGVEDDIRVQETIMGPPDQKQKTRKVKQDEMPPVYYGPPVVETQAQHHKGGEGNATVGAWYGQGGETHGGQKGLNPVSGWLVCVKGGAKGRDFRVQHGMNTIGREAGNAIQITGDETISRERHATITFDPKSRRFLVLHVSGQNLTYVNDNPALQVTEVQAYDRIQVGDTVLVFVPLVGDRFSWDDEKS